MTGIARRLAALRLRRRRLRCMLCARRGQIEAVLCFLAPFRTRLRFARVVARAFRARLRVGRTAFGARAFAAASPAAATTASTTTPTLAAVTTVTTITTIAAFRTPALCSLWLLRSRLGLRRGLLRARSALAMLLLAACTLSAIGASCVRLFARLALVTLSVTPVVAAGRCFVLVVVPTAAIAITVAMMTPVTVTIPVAIAAVATFVPVAPSFVR